MPAQPTYRSQILDHLGFGDVIDQGTQHHPEMRDLTTGEAVNAMGLNGLGCIKQALYLVPRFFHHTPTDRLIAPRVAPDQLHDEALGRALDSLYADGVTERDSRMAATAAERLGLTPRLAHLDRTSFPVDGRYNRDEEPAEQVIHITRGDSRDHRPDLKHVMLEQIVAHQAGIPILLQPLRGNSRDAQAFGQVIRAHLDQLHTTDGVTSVVAARALSRAANLQKLAHTAMQWSTRVPATLSAAQAALAQVDPQALASLQEGYRAHEVTSPDGGIAPRWVLLDSESRQPQAQRTVDRQLRQQRDQEVNALQKLCSSAFACDAEARQALATCEQDLQATCLSASSVRATPR